MSKSKPQGKFEAYARFLAADGFMHAPMAECISAVSLGPVQGAEHVTAYQISGKTLNGPVCFSLGIETRHVKWLEWFLNGGLADCECCGHA